MTLLHPLLLAGAGLIVVPIVLHLIMRQQPKHLEFPALRFIRKREDANRRRLRVRHWLLLLLRCAVVALLAAALARPSIRASGMLGDQEAPVAAALVFDTNPRLDYRHQNRTRLQTAQETALWLLSKLPLESEVAAIDSRTGSAAFAVDLGAARQRIKNLSTSPVALPLSTVVEDALRLVAQSEKPRKEVYVFTDLSRSTWSSSSTQGLQKRLRELHDVGVYVIDVGVNEPVNFALAEVRLSGQMLSRNSPLRIAADIACFGPGGERAVELYMLDPTTRVPSKRSQETVSLGSGDTQSIEFRVGGLGEGIHQGYLKIVGEDALACDDMRFFTVQVKPAWRVLIAAPDKPADYALFLSEALAPYAIRLKGEAAFECDVVSLGELAKRTLSEYQAVCILDPTPLASDTWQQLGRYASEGGGVGIFLGHNAHPVDSYNQAAAQELLPGTLVRQWRAGDRDVYLAPESLEHPLLSKFRSLESSIPWDAFPVFRHWELGKLADGVGIVMPFSNNEAALLEKPVGKGRVLTMTTPISDPASRSDTWNVLPTGDEPWPFVMLANEMLYYLVGSREVRLNYLAGETAMLPLTVEQYRPAFSVKPPSGDGLNYPVDEKQRALVVSTTDVPGNYRAEAGGEEGGVRLGFSVNLAGDVSQLERVKPDELKAVFGETPFRIAASREEINRSVSIGRAGRELYPLLIMLVALLLGGELVLSNRFYKHSHMEPKRSTAELVASLKEPQDRPPEPVSAEPG